MNDILAGEQGPRAPRAMGLVGVLVDGDRLPVGTHVVDANTLDTETYGEADLSDLELLSVALQDAMDAHSGGQLRGPGLDAGALRRAERRARKQDSARALRNFPHVGAA